MSEHERNLHAGMPDGRIGLSIARGRAARNAAHMRMLARWRPRARWPVLMALAALIAAAPAHASFTQEGGPIQVGTDPYGVVAADFNGDGHPDVATVNGTSSNLSVLLRQPAGGFAQEAGSPFPLGSGPDYGAAADFNGD